MKTLPISSFRSGLNGLLKITVTFMAMTAVSACASLNCFFKQADSSLPIETVDAGSGRIMSFRAHETADRLYVAGHAKPLYLKTTTHVDVQLIGPDGIVIAEERDDIDRVHPLTTGARGRRHSYVASFPVSEARQAARIRVIYHGDAHSKPRS